MLMTAWPTELNCWCVAVCCCLDLHGAAANIPTFSRNIILRASTKGPWIYQQKKKPTTTERHTFQETDCGGKRQIGLACISDLLLNRLHDLSLALSFFMLWTNPARPELTPGTPCVAQVAQGHEAGAVLPLHTLRPLQGGLSRLALKPFPCTSCRTKAESL